MSKKRFSGSTLVIKIDVTGAGTAFNQVTVGRNCQVPGREKGVVDCQGIDDTAPEPRPGQVQPSEFSFECLWDPSDTQDAAIATAHADNTLCNFQAITTDGSDTLTDEWDGYITALNPLSLDESTPKVMQVVGYRKGAVSEGVA